MAEHLVKTLCHIVFILKLYSKFLLGLFHCPAYLQLAPLPEELCSSGNAADADEEEDAGKYGFHALGVL